MQVPDIVQEAVIKTIPKKKEMQKGKKGGMRRPYKELRKEEKLKAKEKGKKIYPSECKVPKNSKERKESLP